MEGAGPGARTATLTAIALVAFAANSVLCRLALGERAIDAASFTTLRLGSGAVALGIIRLLVPRPAAPRIDPTWLGAFLLFLYAVGFSFAYLSLGAGTGALILFASVQFTMILGGLRAGERPHVGEGVGLLLALAGLAYLVWPGLTAPSPVGAGLMTAAGFAWGVYSLRGRAELDPLAATADSFLRTVPFVLVLSGVFLSSRTWSSEGFALAVLSGAGTSGLGYVIWYAALQGLTATRAAIVQLAVPVLAAAGGVLFLSEPLSLRLLSSAIAILGGIAMAVLGHGTSPPRAG